MSLLKNVSDQKPREITMDILGRRTGGEFIETLLEQRLSQTRISAPDRRLCHELAYGIIRWQMTLDWLIARKTGNRTQKPALQNLLRLGLYQIFWLERIPNHAAVNETVELAKTRGFGAQSGFVNAILRGYLREFDATKQALLELKNNQPALGYSHPEWLVQRWEPRWGREQTKQLLEWNNIPPKTFARINSLKADAGKLLTQWRNEDVEYDFVRRDWLEENLIFELKSHPPLASLPSFAQGLFYIQDPSTLLAVSDLDPHPGEAVLDLCAAPGGKLTYIAQLMQNQGRLVAHDTKPDRLRLVQQNCDRLGVTCAQTESAAEFRQFGSAKTSPGFDRILVDAPCSNTGVMRRRVDLRWRIRPEEVQRLSAGQLSLLKAASAVLKPGGTLIYSTCSLEPEENAEVVGAFLKTSPQIQLQKERELQPFKDGVDGAYVARLVRTS
ncbi:MAG TPA: 16S rRNA (cytosine(967)-C(5))-methyltransferase RsmB [Candidatus Limnocylindrales bacterium]|jgi:16S rRNA (cytosine967-C5)-methyltransferase|nr:16S rRNA (cytosine(967)-C(5))-methyltransferase RsmB [Candidatus Limnocylindrales bacterium]